MRILVTRPAVDAARTAAALRVRGHEAIVAPLLTIEYFPDAELGDRPWSVILVTSANAARAIAAHRRRDELLRVPGLAVGGQSAQELRAEGFADVISANGDLDDL
ncbi:MAG: uroporphyrinogen-III synthase, partial [Xanthobacteraceae bacterium]